MDWLSSAWDKACSAIITDRTTCCIVSNFGYWVCHPRAYYVECILWPRLVREGRCLLEA